MTFISCQSKNMFFFFDQIELFYGIFINIHTYLLLWYLLIWIGYYYCAWYIDQPCLSNRLGLPESLVDVLANHNRPSGFRYGPHQLYVGFKFQRLGTISISLHGSPHRCTCQTDVFFSFFLIHLFFLFAETFFLKIHLIHKGILLIMLWLS